MLKIKEVSEYFNLPSETIRYWEKVGIIPHISRNESGYREFNEEVVNWIKLVKCMREIKIPVEQIQCYLSLVVSEKDTTKERIDILEQQKTQLYKKIQEYNSALETITYKINNYENVLQNYENALNKKGGDLK